MELAEGAMIRKTLRVMLGTYFSNFFRKRRRDRGIKDDEPKVPVSKKEI